MKTARNEQSTGLQAMGGAAAVEIVGHGAVEFRGVSKIYDGVPAVENVDLKINPGEFVSLLGPSGSGKSTLLMMLAGFTDVTSGTILVDGQRLDRVPPNRRNQGIVFQSYALFPHMSVRENVEFPLKARGVAAAAAKKLVDAALDRVRMSMFADRRPAQLSGGQQQRVALARATVFDPPLILMDESLSALDRKLREEMRVEIKDLHLELGKTIIYVTHDQQEALTMSDRIVVLRNGKIAQVGKPLDVYESPSDSYVAGFVGDANFFSGVVGLANSGLVEVVTPSTRMHVHSDLKCVAGDKVVAMVRPEAIQLGPRGMHAGERECITLPGIVGQVAFLGNAHEYHVKVDDQMIVAKIPRSFNNVLHQRGAAVEVSFAMDDVHLFNA
ncbi:ABC transporter ATP-binding protein [Variovorax sp. LT1R20]|uniref:ABC transporter ATP-binding protein n=1 Tax=Variovorax sp. LT1R20 TaxID=3443729 RepID=UPI003F4596BD